MQALPDDTDISTFEDLEPQPKEGRGLSHLREFLLGFALIVAVLVWGGYHWVEDQHLLTVYRSAQQAEADQNLDRALVLYQSIPGYKDSNTRASQTARTISQRDLSYRQATTATEKNDWPAAYQAARLTNQAQAGYKNTQSLLDEAEKQVYSQALSGTVALRIDGIQSGLYYRTSNGWVWLRGSDQSSTVQGLGPPGHVIYDIPGAATSIPPDFSWVCGNPGTNTDVSVSPPQRSLMLATIRGNDLSYLPLALNPLDYDFYIWGEHGVWGLHDGNGIVDTPNWGLRDDYSGYTIDYHAYNSPQISKIRMPDGSWQIKNLAPTGDAMLIAASVHYGGLLYGTSTLYLAGPDGQNLRPIYSGLEDISSAHFSPDSRYVLLNIYHPVGGSKDVQQSVILIDVKTNKEWVLGTRRTGPSTGGINPALGATFLTQGTLRGKILLFQWEPDSKLYNTSTAASVFSLIDPASPGTSLAEAESNSYPPGSVWVSEGQGGQCLLIAWQDGPSSTLANGETITAVKLEPGRPGYVQKFDLGTTGGTLTGAWLRDGNMVFTTRTPALNPLEPRSTYRIDVRSVNLVSTLSGTNAGPVSLYTVSTSGPPHFSYTTLLSAGPKLFAYVENGQLHARSYDGTVDLPLETGIVGLYNFPYEAIHWLK